MKFKAKAFNPAKHTLPVWAHFKIDGHRIKVIGHPQDGLIALTTVGHDLSHILRDYDWWRMLEKRVKDHQSFEMELCSSQGVSHVKTALKHRLPLQVFLFATADLPEDESLPHVERYLSKYELPFAGYCCTYDGFNYEDLTAKLGLEGFIFKDGNYLNWLKYKVERTIDLIVTGFKDGRNKNIGLTGSLECSTTEGYVVCNCAGMSDALRVSIDEDSDLGRIIEVKYQTAGSDGKLRHPRFLRWRDDKTADECSVSQDPLLEEIWKEKC